MRAYLRAGLIVSTALGFAGMALGQSSSPFSGLFGGSSEAEGPVSLDIRVQGDDGDLKKTIRNTSLVAGALQEGRTTGQDVLAAARADYARILGALYDEGRYSALIYITLDGVEAAEDDNDVREVVPRAHVGQQRHGVGVGPNPGPNRLS